ncbi:ankyrin repeat domain-containing protein 66 isoform X2 [Cololabis saira]|uniref:ankyrin repeat domain-containing protein 66 isoform X2 n=1 Tax=Cololabis saira TaxID=129043 RepID=UPI002AD233B8|nr:ankyrin repeat domain-containing protein 66 isoform X2 [Cololabis saira]
MTELHQAAAAGRCEEVEQFLRENKCSPNEKDVDWGNKTPLHWAAAKEIVCVLLEHGARPSLRTEHGWTAAHYAAESGHLAVLRLLHHFHAPVDKEDSCGDKPARVAQIYGHHDCVQFLKKAELECREYRNTAAREGLSLDDTDDEWDGKGK